MRGRIYLYVLALMLLLCSGFTPVAEAASYKLPPVSADRLEKGNVKYSYSLDPGVTFSDTLKIERKVSFKDVDDVDVDLYFVDAHMTANGFLGMSSEVEKQKHIGKWFSYEKDNVQFSGEGVLEVPFTITLPENVTPGEYVGGFILIEAPREEVISERNDAEISTGSKIRLRYATTVALNISGERTPSYIINDLNYEVTEEGDINAYFRFLNTGNTTYGISGALSYDGMVNEGEKDLSERLVIPGEEVFVVEPLGKAKSFIGKHNLLLELSLSTDPGAGEIVEFVERELSIGYYPPILWGILAFAFALIYGIIYGLIRRLTQKWIPYKVKKGEHIYVLADVFKTSVKKLAKQNNLVPPYTLKTGQTILVPSNEKKMQQREVKKKKSSRKDSR